ncbi:MAG: bifunctional enoyl-CoA hydratase/phosphate acetyltransferase [Roseateles sp.]|uniref:bifunctional enoyl-CoA hydratase/phosphate acetyltransferase n=1 Tax=Roseateles sp. TaxID=1971397 RepID=UPI0039ED5011
MTTTDPSPSPAPRPPGRSFDDISVGEQESVERLLTPENLQLFAALAGSGASVDAGIAGRAFAGAGAWVGGLVAAAIGDCLPGVALACRGQRLRFPAPVRAGDRLRVTVAVAERRAAEGSLLLRCSCVNEAGETVIDGEVEVAPADVPGADALPEPGIHIGPDGDRRRLMARAGALAPIRVAVVHPCDEASLSAALDARRAGLIEPVLVAPRAKLDAVAAQCGLDLAGIEVIDAAHSHAAADRAVALAGQGEVEALMKGSLHTDELMSAVLAPASRLRTKRRISHCFVLQAPGYPRPVIVTDAAINLAPDLAQKADIVRNAIELAQVIGVPEPKVAILAAVETVNPAMPATLDAAALCKMADRGQITGGRLDGPLAFDNAISLAAARTKGIVSPVAGQADILLVPDLESGNMLAKQLIYLGQAASAGIVMGARVPVILTSRADSRQARIASCALALLLAHHYRQAAP